MPATTSPRSHAAPKRAAPRRKPPQRRRKGKKPDLIRILIPVLALVVVVGIVVNLTGGDQMTKLARDRTPYWVDKQIIAINGTGRRGRRSKGSPISPSTTPAIPAPPPNRTTTSMTSRRRR